MNKRVMWGMAALVSMPLIAGAQTGKTDPAKPKTDPAAKPAATVQTPPAKPAGGPTVHTAKELVGMKVQNPQGESLGKIDDVVVLSNGDVSYAVLSFGGVMGLGDKLFAIPWGCMQTAGTGKDTYVVLGVDKERLKAAPGFDKDNWPKLLEAGWCADVDKYYANEKHAPRAIEASAKTADTLTFRASELNGRNVETPTGEKLGDIKQVVLDPSNGRVNYVAVSVGGFLGIGDRIVAVPWEAIKIVHDGEKVKLTLNATKDMLEKAPEFHEGDAAWREMSDPVWIGKVYEYYSVRPYWSSSAKAPAAPPPASTKPTKTDKGD
jgi:sporulation protein YlmC with PRC-barrel domain